MKKLILKKLNKNFKIFILLLNKRYIKKIFGIFNYTNLILNFYFFKFNILLKLGFNLNKNIKKLILIKLLF